MFDYFDGEKILISVRDVLLSFLFFSLLFRFLPSSQFVLSNYSIAVMSQENLIHFLEKAFLSSLFHSEYCAVLGINSIAILVNISLKCDIANTSVFLLLVDIEFLLLTYTITTFPFIVNNRNLLFSFFLRSYAASVIIRYQRDVLFLRNLLTFWILRKIPHVSSRFLDFIILFFFSEINAGSKFSEEIELFIFNFRKTLQREIRL